MKSFSSLMLVLLLLALVSGATKAGSDSERPFAIGNGSETGASMVETLHFLSGDICQLLGTIISSASSCEWSGVGTWMVMVSFKLKSHGWSRHCLAVIRSLRITT